MAKKKLKTTKTTDQTGFVNPIDKDKIAENPGLLPYAHSVGGAMIRPEDKGKVRGNAMLAMYDQTDRQVDQLKQQMNTLLQQAEELKNRMAISEMIYAADVPFHPIIHHIYYLYQRKKDGTTLLSMISPEEWGASIPYEYIARVRLLGDHTWEVQDGKIVV